MEHQSKSLRTALVLLILPALLMLVQVIPVPRGLANPVWQSAASALGQRLIGSITVDTGRTVLATVQYLTMLGLLVASSAVAINRNRAATLLVWLTAASTTMAFLLIAGDLRGIDSFAANEALQAGSALGVVISAANIVRIVEQYEISGRKQGSSFLALAATAAVYLLAHAICWFAVLRFAATQLIFATACGFALTILVIFTRRLGAGRWAIVTFVGLTFVVVLGLVSAAYKSEGDLTVRYSSAPQAEIAFAQRLRADTPWQGLGAGSFAVLAPIYQQLGGVVSGPPTAASALSIELGTPALCYVAVVMLWFLAILFQGALTRGRDSYYPALGGSAGLLILIEGFIDSSALQASIMIFMAVIGGLGLAQAASRTSIPKPL